MITLARVVAKKLSSPKEKEQRVVLLGLDRGGKTRLFEWTQATLFHRPVRSDDDVRALANRLARLAAGQNYGMR